MTDPICVNCGRRQSEHFNNYCQRSVLGGEEKLSTTFKRDEDYLDASPPIDLAEGDYTI